MLALLGIVPLNWIVLRMRPIFLFIIRNKVQMQLVGIESLDLLLNLVSDAVWLLAC
jgi:hypothetical protein